MNPIKEKRDRPALRIACITIILILAIIQSASQDSRATPDPISFNEEFQNRLKKADLGDPASAFEVARFYHKDIRGPRDFNLAVKYYEISGKNGFCSGWYELGMIYSNGKLVKKDIPLAERFFTMSKNCYEESVQNGMPTSPIDQYAYGMILKTDRTGEGIRRSLAFEHLLRSAASGISESVIEVSVMCLLEGMIPETLNKDDIIDMLSDLALSGDVAAISTSRQISEYNELTELQRNKLSSSAKGGFELLTAEASLSDPALTRYAALCYFSGIETKQSEENGISYLLISANLGNIDAMFDLAEIYRIRIMSSMSDSEILENHQKAIFWYKLAANRGDIRSKITLENFK